MSTIETVNVNTNIIPETITTSMLLERSSTVNQSFLELGQKWSTMIERVRQVKGDELVLLEKQSGFTDLDKPNEFDYIIEMIEFLQLLLKVDSDPKYGDLIREVVVVCCNRFELLNRVILQRIHVIMSLID